MNKSIKYLFLILSFLFFLTSCEKRIADPQKLDLIYNDLNAELQTTISVRSQLKSSLDEYKKMLETAKPQSGQNKNYNAKIENISKKIIQIEQSIKGLELSIESREKEIRLRYISSLSKKSDWIDKKELDEYIKNKKLKQSFKQSDKK